MFKLESGVKVQSKSRTSKYVEFLKGVKAGQSFAKTEDGKPVTETHVASLRHAAQELGVGIITRKQDGGGFRVWVESAPKRSAK